MKNINTIIVDDHPLARKGIISILSQLSEFGNIKEAGNVSKAEEIISNNEIDLGIIDLRLGEDSGIDIVIDAKKKNRNTKFVLLTSFLDVNNFTKAEELGVCGYILKESLPEDIIYGLRIVMRGKKFYDSEIICRKKENNLDCKEKLTEREKEVLKEIGIGHTNREISDKLYISEYTTKKHVSNILCKLNLSNRAQIVYMVNKKIS